jgi:hypothetical protein
VDVAAVDLQLLKALLTPELKLAPGREVMARVVRAQAGLTRGALSIAGNVLDAQLPKKLAAGDEVKLVVRDISAGRVVLSLVHETPPMAQVAGQPLPGGGRVRVTEREQSPTGAGEAISHTLAIRYDAPSLGPVDLRFVLDPASLRVTVAVAAGGAFEQASGAAARLGEALSASVERGISVTVTPRHDPVELYA